MDLFGVLSRMVAAFSNSQKTSQDLQAYCVENLKLAKLHHEIPQAGDSHKSAD